MLAIRMLRTMARMTRAGRPALPDVEFLTVPEVAEYLRISKVTVYRWIASGELPARRIGLSGRNLRIEKTAVERAMAQSAVPE
jgi:excisionase family DNA binding protein